MSYVLGVMVYVLGVMAYAYTTTTTTTTTTDPIRRASGCLVPLANDSS
jgi:hypothetical protein